MKIIYFSQVTKSKKTMKKRNIPRIDFIGIGKKNKTDEHFGTCTLCSLKHPGMLFTFTKKICTPFFLKHATLPVYILFRIIF